jgi:aminopeptidase N
MKDATPPTIHLKDYAPPPYGVETIDLTFELDPKRTRVTAVTKFFRRGEEAAPLVLEGEAIELESVKVDGEALGESEYTRTPEGLTIPDVPARFTLEVVGLIAPAENTSLNGLYVSRDMYCTQCEAQGFRRITFFPDRPDVMAKFTTTIIADKTSHPVLLSNGNLVEEKALEDGKHLAKWEDPFKKPAYLFALVAGDLARREDTFTTASGREVTLHLYTEPEQIPKTKHAMESLKASMKWDEDVYGLEYDLDMFMIVAVSDFNFGAMENKGLNIFNTRYVLADPETATDMDFAAIEGVVGHEYFHNWTGNRVTCRDWFQLSLKEGLTVFRDQEFSADMGSRAVKRIEDVQRLRAHQFVEDGGPTAHPVRPASYVEINNFYTATVYEKGAEVVRMYHTLIGPELFRKGMDLYFERHDGQAVTCDDFASAMADASGRDLTTFKRWYAQAGTPVVEASGAFDGGVYTLTLKQTVPATPGQPDKEPMVIPVRMGLLSKDGRALDLVTGGQALGQETVLELTGAEASFEFSGLDEKPIPSLLRGFSAPVRLVMHEEVSDVLVRLAHDPDSFNRWEAAQELFRDILKEACGSGAETQVPGPFLEALGTLLDDDGADPALVAKALSLPSEAEIPELLDAVDPEQVHAGREAVITAIATKLEDKLRARYAGCDDDGPFELTPVAVGRRSLKNACLSYLSRLEDDGGSAQAALAGATNMTDKLAALLCLVGKDDAVRAEPIAGFYDAYKSEALVLDKWFGAQAVSPRLDTVEKVRELLAHPDFSMKNPNKVRAVVGAFAASNPRAFHREDGAGYRLLGEVIAELDAINGQVAARILIPLTRHAKLDEGRAKMMKDELEKLVQRPDVSRDVYEIASKGLA